jgi:oligosaccharide repeat unit polymerase
MDNKFFYDLKNPTNGAFVIWIIVFCLFLLDVTNEFIKPTVFASLVIISYILVFFFNFKSIRINGVGREVRYQYKKNSIIFSTIAFALLIFELAYEYRVLGGFPLTSVADWTNPINYNDAQLKFGVRHTLLVKINLLYLFGFFLVDIFYRKKTFFAYFVLFLTVCCAVLLLKRSILMSMLVLWILAYVLTTKIKLKSILMGVIMILPLSFIFSTFVDVRNLNNGNYVEKQLQEKTVVEESIIGFTDMYLYAVRPISNLVENINYDKLGLLPIEPASFLQGFLGMNFFPYFFNYKVIDFEKHIILSEGATIPAFSTLLFSFGFLGSLVFLCVLCLFMNKIYCLYMKNNGKFALILINVYSLIILSIFSVSLSDATFFLLLVISHYFRPLEEVL